MADTATAPDTDWVPTDSFVARLALVRIERHWNITQAAQACGIDPENWRGWERGRSPHKIHDVARKIADGTGVNYVWLLAGGPLRSRCFACGQPLDGRPECPSCGAVQPVRSAPQLVYRHTDQRLPFKLPPVKVRRSRRITLVA